MKNNTDWFNEILAATRDSEEFNGVSGEYLDFRSYVVPHSVGETFNETTFSCWAASFEVLESGVGIYVIFDENGPDGWVEKGSIPAGHQDEVERDLNCFMSSLCRKIGVSGVDISEAIKSPGKVIDITGQLVSGKELLKIRKSVGKDLERLKSNDKAIGL